MAPIDRRLAWAVIRRLKSDPLIDDLIALNKAHTHRRPEWHGVDYKLLNRAGGRVWQTTLKAQRRPTDGQAGEARDNVRRFGR